jgi:hypothetical protein
VSNTNACFCLARQSRLRMQWDPPQHCFNVASVSQQTEALRQPRCWQVTCNRFQPALLLPCYASPVASNTSCTRWLPAA